MTQEITEEFLTGLYHVIDLTIKAHVANSKDPLGLCSEKQRVAAVNTANKNLLKARQELIDVFAFGDAPGGTR